MATKMICCMAALSVLFGKYYQTVLSICLQLYEIHFWLQFWSAVADGEVVISTAGGGFGGYGGDFYGGFGGFGGYGLGLGLGLGYPFLGGYGGFGLVSERVIRYEII